MLPLLFTFFRLHRRLRAPFYLCHSASLYFTHYYLLHTTFSGDMAWLVHWLYKYKDVQVYFDKRNLLVLNLLKYCWMQAHYTGDSFKNGKEYCARSKLVSVRRSCGPNMYMRRLGVFGRVAHSSLRWHVWRILFCSQAFTSSLLTDIPMAHRMLLHLVTFSIVCTLYYLVFTGRFVIWFVMINSSYKPP